MLLADLDLNKTYTYADYFKWKFEERVELIRGRIFKMSPAPSRKHQRITGDIFSAMNEFVKGRKCEVYIAQFDVRLPRRSKDDQDIITVVQPDICVICDPSKLDDRGCLGAPDIVVEILSPGNNAKELKNKYDIYEESGVKEYWVVSPQNEYFIACRLVDGKYHPSRMLTTGDIVTTSILPGFELDLAKIFEDNLS